VNAKQLIANFGRISDTVEASPRLRQFIVDLAVRGVLLAQDPGDEPASRLLQRALVEKRLGEKKERKTRKPVPELEQSQVPFSVPKGWAWTRLETLSNRIHYGYTASARKDLLDVRLLRITDIQDNLVDWATVPGCVISPQQVGQYQLEAGDILFARTGGTVGKTFLVEDIPVTAVFASYLIRVQPSSEMSPRYLKLFFESSLYWDQLREGARGGAQPNVNGKILGRMSVTVPPLAEQRRIVAKVDELMTLCDELEEVQETCERRRDLLAITSQRRMIEDTADPEGLRHSAGFYLGWLPRLTTRLEHISELRRTILDLAVQGLLVSQDEADEPVAAVLGRVRDQQQAYLDAGIIRRAPKWESPEELERTLHLPQSWEQAELGWLAVKIGSGSTPRGGKRAYTPEGVPFIRSQNVYNDGLRLDGVALIPEAIHRKMSGTHVHTDDILLNITGASIGRCALVADEVNEANVSQHVSIIRLFLPELRNFIHLALVSPYFQRMIQDVQVGVSREGLSARRLREFPMPIPPMEEQKRIVTKANELMAVCDKLETQLREGSSKRSRLLEAVLHEALVETSEVP
jgi:type I restriction enzyme S subunit